MISDQQQQQQSIWQHTQEQRSTLVFEQYLPQINQLMEGSPLNHNNKKPPHKNFEKDICSLFRQVQKNYLKLLRGKDKLTKHTNSTIYSQMFWDQMKDKSHPSLKTLKTFLIHPQSYQHLYLNQNSSQFQKKFSHFLKFISLQQIEQLRLEAKHRILSQRQILIAKAETKKNKQLSKYLQKFLDNLQKQNKICKISDR